MLPLFLINIIIFGINWLGGEDDSLLTKVTVILLVLVAYLPTIRAEIPSQPYFTMIDYIIISLIVQCLVSISPIFITNKEIIEGNWRERGTLITSGILFATWVLYVIGKCIQYPIRKRKHDKPTPLVKLDSRIYSAGDEK